MVVVACPYVCVCVCLWRQTQHILGWATLFHHEVPSYTHIDMHDLHAYSHSSQSPLVFSFILRVCAAEQNISTHFEWERNSLCFVCMNGSRHGSTSTLNTLSNAFLRCACIDWFGCWMSERASEPDVAVTAVVVADDIASQPKLLLLLLLLLRGRLAVCVFRFFGTFCSVYSLRD